MSPALTVADVDLDGFPRVSGDEPVWDRQTRDTQPFSPRERG